MKAKNLLFKAAIILILLGFIGCDNETTGKDFSGSWWSTVYGFEVSVIIANNEWHLSTIVFSDFGSYTLTSETTACLFSEKYRLEVGVAEAINNNTIMLILNDRSIATGTYILRRR